MGDYGENDGPVGGINPPIPVVTESSGSLYGTEALLGGNAPEPDTSESAIVENPEFVPGQSADRKLGLYLDFNSVDAPQPVRGGYGAPEPGPRTYYYERINPDVYAPVGTDNGDVPQAMWPLGLSHNRQGSEPGAGFARQQNVKVLPSATAMAGVDMRLGPNAYRELHWHTANEWSLILKGCVRVSSVNDESQTFVDDVCAGDTWFFPSGVPHSIQAFEGGVEFLLVFDDGNFSEDETFLVSEMMLRTPISVLAKNFEADPSAFNNLPQDELYVSTKPTVFSPTVERLLTRLLRFSTEHLNPKPLTTHKTSPPQAVPLTAPPPRIPITGPSKTHTSRPAARSRSSTQPPSPSPRTSRPRSSPSNRAPCARSTGTRPRPSGTTSCKGPRASPSSQRPRPRGRLTSPRGPSGTSRRQRRTTSRTRGRRT